MSSHEVRIEKIIQQIKALQASVEMLKRERDGLREQVLQLELKIKQKREEGESDEMVIKKNQLSEVLDRQIEEIDACLDLLKTI